MAFFQSDLFGGGHVGFLCFGSKVGGQVGVDLVEWSFADLQNIAHNGGKIFMSMVLVAYRFHQVMHERQGGG